MSNNHTKNEHKQIAIVGYSAAGKTVFINIAKNLGYKILICDEFVANLYSTNKIFIQKVANLFGNSILKDNMINKPLLKQFLHQHPERFSELEQAVFAEIFKHLETNKYDFVEIPKLNTSFVDFSIFFEQIWFLDIPNRVRDNFQKNKHLDHFTKKLINSLNNYNWAKLKNFRNIPVITIPWKHRNTTKKIINLLKKLP
ncbi:dephospho-CoA kinase [Mycoplasma corogypsi]|uniref:dephospho-CoA kinase n=1 Tax=Mycoplasma corogypsi TaxID=2106 RepID=UPI003872E556